MEVTLGTRLEIVCSTCTPLVPEPRSAAGIGIQPSVFRVVPYSNWYVVSYPTGFTVACRRADLTVISVASAPETSGEGGAEGEIFSPGRSARVRGDDWVVEGFSAGSPLRLAWTLVTPDPARAQTSGGSIRSPC